MRAGGRVCVRSYLFSPLVELRGIRYNSLSWYLTGYLKVYRMHFYFITVCPPEVSQHFVNSVRTTQSSLLSLLLPNHSPAPSVDPPSP